MLTFDSCPAATSGNKLSDGKAFHTHTYTTHILHSQSLAKNFMAPSGMLNCTINLKHELLINNLA